MRSLLSALTLLAGLLLALPASAQGFISPVSSISPKQPAYVELPDGSKVEGTVPLAMFMNGGLRSFTLLTSGGEKMKFKAGDVTVLANKPGALAKLSALGNQMDSKWDMITADWGEVIDREWVYYRQALMPNGKSYALLQLINPGFDSRLQVFNQDPEEPDEYLVVKDGKISVKITKGNYKKSFGDLFGDCAKLMEPDTSKKPKVKDFAAHAYIFDRACGKK